MIDVFKMSFPADDEMTERDVYVYLPTAYDREKERNFPVLYMFDGQNVFFDEDATYGKSWGLGKYLDYTDTPLIVAAVQCNTSGDNFRLSEYSPFPFHDSNYGDFEGKGESTMQWMIRELKPRIDSEYRTLPDREHTLIAGSSMGGLMSLYALIKHNDIYSRAAALSPSIWVDRKALENLALSSSLSKDSILYMDYGADEFRYGKGMLNSFAVFTSKLMKKGIMVCSRIIPSGDHSEQSWEKQNPLFIQTIMYGFPTD